MTDGEKANRDLDKQLEEDRARAALDFKILLLGAGESGKSTVVKQLRNINKGNAAMTEDEIHSYVAVLHTNTVQSIRVLLRACETFDIEISGEEAELAAAIDAVDENHLLSEEHAGHIVRLWGSEPIRAAYGRRHEIYFPDAAPYYFDNIHRFVEEGFIPTEEDVVMARIRTTGMFMTQFDGTMGVHWRVVDVGGQRSERKKWIRFFDDVQSILFVVNLAGYCQVLFEDQTKNRMQEALELFESTVRIECFRDTPIFLFLNKKDLFEDVLRNYELSEYFPEYQDEKTDTQAALQFIAKQFESRMPGQKKIANVHYIAARYKKDIKYAFEDIQNFLMSENQKKINKAIKKLQ